MRLQCFNVAAKFFDRHNCLGLLAGMARPGADTREADLLQNLADRALMINDAETLLDDALQVNASPADHAAFRSIRPRLDHLGDSGQLLGRKPWRGAFRAEVLQPFRAQSVEAMNSIAQRLSIHAADPHRLFPAHPVRHSARDKSRRLWLASFGPAASRRNSMAEKSVLIFTVAGVARILLAPGNHLNSILGIPSGSDFKAVGTSPSVWKSSATRTHSLCHFERVRILRKVA